MENKNVYGSNFPKARLDAIERSNNICQFCGMHEATHAHHWALSYPSGTEVTADDLTALCFICHDIATALRRFMRNEGNIFQFRYKLKELMESCGIDAQLKERPNPYARRSGRA